MRKEAEGYVLTRRERKKLNCKYTILKTAKELIVTEGVEVPVERIAEKSDISYPTFFNYFPTKATLFYEIYLEEIEDLKEFISIELVEESSASKRLEMLYEAMMKDFVRYKYLDLYIAGEVAKKKEEQGGREEISEMFRDEIERGIELGEFSKDVNSKHYSLIISGIVLSSSFYTCAKKDYKSMIDILIRAMRSGA